MEEQNNSNIQKKVIKINLKVFIIIAIAVAIVAIAVIGLVIRNKKIEEKRKAEELEKERNVLTINTSRI